MSKENLFTIPLRDKQVFYVKQDGVNHVLIRPICEVFGIDADWQIRELKKDEIFGPEVCEHTTQVPSDIQKRQHTCLPEEMIYGWLLGIKFSNTMAEETKGYLIEYKKECYHVLYNHFHGRVSEADQMLKEKAKLQREVNGIKSRLYNENEEYRSLVEKEAQLKSYGNPYTRLGNVRSKELKEDLFSVN